MKTAVMTASWSAAAIRRQARPSGESDAAWGEPWAGKRAPSDIGGRGPKRRR